MVFFFFSSRRRHTISYGDWSSDVCSSDLVLERALTLARSATRDLRTLCDELEPHELREIGFSAAVGALSRRVSSWRGVEIELDIELGSDLGEHAQVGLYQIVREAIDQAVRRGAPSRIEVRLEATEGGGAALTVS